METPTEVPLIDRSKEELVAIVGRLKENLSWYVEERNRLIAESQQSEPDAYGYCEYSAIHRETAHFREPGCIKWRPL